LTQQGKIPAFEMILPGGGAKNATKRGAKYLKVTGSSVENPRRPRQSRLKAIFEVKMK
jgi:hypothetical protein